MYLYQNLKFDPSVQRTVEDTQYPAGWFLDPLERARIGVVEVSDPVRPDDRFFTSVENPDGSYTATPTRRKIWLRDTLPKKPTFSFRSRPRQARSHNRSCRALIVSTSLPRKKLPRTGTQATLLNLFLTASNQRWMHGA